MSDDQKPPAAAKTANRHRVLSAAGEPVSNAVVRLIYQTRAGSNPRCDAELDQCHTSSRNRQYVHSCWSPAGENRLFVALGFTLFRLFS